MPAFQVSMPDAKLYQFRAYCELANLRKNLYKGGVSKDILDASFHLKMYKYQKLTQAV